MSNDLARVFAQDPLTHTDEDLKLIIAELRKARAIFNSTPAAKAAKPAAVKVDLSDLEL